MTLPRLFAVLAAALLGGCAGPSAVLAPTGAPTPPQAQSPAPGPHAQPASAAAAAAQPTDSTALAVDYALSVYDAAVFRASNVRALPAVEADTFVAVSWVGDGARRFYPEGQRTTLGVDVWVTRPPQVQAVCHPYAADPGARHLRLQQYLGLPPEPPATSGRFVAVLRVAAADVFRPCPNPSLQTTACEAGFPWAGSAPDSTQTAHQAWMAGQALASYQVPDGYPWTRLGYTYDWAPGSTGLGAYEYVVRRGSTVEVVSTQTTEAYCATAPTTTVYLVRHAEKEAEPAGDPALTPGGAQRAAALADSLADSLAEAGLWAVYSSQFQRTRQTAAPVAARAGRAVTILPITGPDVGATLRAQARRIAAENAGGAALVAGHSNTVPTMIAELTGHPMPDLDESEYGDLFVVTIAADGTARLARRRFGD